MIQETEVWESLTKSTGLIQATSQRAIRAIMILMANAPAHVANADATDAINHKSFRNLINQSHNYGFEFEPLLPILLNRYGISTKKWSWRGINRQLK